MIDSPKWVDHTRAGLRRVERLNLGLSAGAAAASLAVAGPHVAGSIALGAVLEVLSFRSLHGSARLFFQGELGGSGLWMGVRTVEDAMNTYSVVAESRLIPKFEAARAASGENRHP